MKIKNRTIRIKIVCFLMSAGLGLGTLHTPLLAGEVSQMEAESAKMEFVGDETETKSEETEIAEPETTESEIAWPEEKELDTEEPEEPDCVEVSNLMELAQAVNEQGQEEMEDFSGKSLLVFGDFNPAERELLASSVLRGYGLTVLFYDREEDAGKEYKTLKKSGLKVEVNAKVELCGDVEFSAVEEEVSGEKGKEERKSRGADVTVAVLDSGYDPASFGEGRIQSGMDFTGENDISDRNGHGTAMAGIVLGSTEDAVKVMPIKIADEAGFTTVLHMYMGMKYAVEQGADIINISMSAYKSAHSSILEEAVKEASEKGVYVVVSAGNQGEDTKDYTPANIPDAVTVSSVNSDKTRASYSNYGEAVDYCAYGAWETAGLSGQKTVAEGTSVSSAIVSSILADIKSQNPEISGAELSGRLDSLAEDLGDAGADSFYGRGFLTMDSIGTKEEEKEEEADGEKEELPELLRCDWKALSDAELNERILDAEDVYKKRFLDDLSEEERKELLGRKDVVYNHRHGAVVVQMSEDFVYGEEKRFQGTLYEYLYSEFFKEFQINGSAKKKHDGESQTIHISASSKGDYFVKLTTSQNKTPARLYVWVDGYSSNPTKKYTLHAAGTDAGAFDFSGISVSANSSGDLYDITVGGIKVNKTKHTTLKGKYQTRSYAKGDPDYKEDESGDGGLGGFQKPGRDSCDGESQKLSFLFTHNDGEHSSSNGRYALTYRLNYSGVYNTTPENWSDWTILENNTCLRNGKRVHTRNLVCSHCKKVAKTESEEEIIPAHGHLFAPGAWSYDTCPVTGIPQGIRFEQCSYNCREEGWRRNYQYLNEIYYRVMDSQGNYPGEYNLYSSGYYFKGAAVPGYTYQDTEGRTNHRTAAVPGCIASDCARRQYLDVPRKEYTVTYNGNGADKGDMGSQKVYFGQCFSLLPNRFLRTGYDFAAFSLEKDGKGEKFADGQKIEKNLTKEDFGTAVLYAQWKPHTYRITLDSQGADVPGTGEVYQKYGEYYSVEKERKVPFENNKISLPEKVRVDETLFDKERKQKFKGYFTEKDGRGQAMVEEDGSLIPNIDKAGNYRYFTKDATVYACYQDMSAIQFSDNLSLEDKKVVGEGENILPKTKWKEQGKDLTVFFEGAEVANQDFKGIYRLLGWSLTPEISSLDELVLSPQKTSYTFSADGDVTLYAQWDSSYNLAYMGNTQTGGTDYLQRVKAAVDNYTFCGNEKEEKIQPGGEGVSFFEKEVEKETFDIATGETKDKDGNPYKEVIPYSFQGWSMFSDRKEQKENKQYKKEKGEWESREILLDAVRTAKEAERRGLTFGAPASEYGNPGDVFLEEKMPYVNLFAIWDEFPQIKASDLYFSTEEARSGSITQDYLLGLAEATDRELEGVTDEKGTMRCGEDRLNDTSFVITDYRKEDFTGAEGSMSFTITYAARDAVGNETKKTVTVHLIDTTAKNYDKGSVRFISKEHVDTLGEKSVWRTEEYAAILKKTLENHKTGEEYTSPTAIEQVFGAKAVKKPGSGNWSTVLQVWQFTHNQVLEVQKFMESRGIKGSQQAFLDKFGVCRVQ